ncbi:MAG: response regulator [Deltaproteobacteria bacterium]|jgi:DNA-binding NtrC family response regulator|nr:response regulator [Deltaproteobacteria bacterium]
MSATILLHLSDAPLKEKLEGFLDGGKYTLLPPLQTPPGGPDAATAAEILASRPDVVVLDYIAEDAWSVKVLQEVTDERRATGFIFADAAGGTDLENLTMAFNEGAAAFVRPDVQKAAFLNMIARICEGPARIRHSRDGYRQLEEDLQSTGQALSKAKTLLAAAQKLVGYLLATPVNAQPRRALVLSDSSYQREMLKKLMEDFNFQVLTASGVDEAVNLALAEKPRIIISDYALEDGRTGVDFCQEMKFNRKFQPLYFVVCTAGLDKLPAIMAPGNGVDDCILKPSSDSSTAEFISRVALGLIF